MRQMRGCRVNSLGKSPPSRSAGHFTDRKLTVKLVSELVSEFQAARFIVILSIRLVQQLGQVNLCKGSPGGGALMATIFTKLGVKFAGESISNIGGPLKMTKGTPVSYLG